MDTEALIKQVTTIAEKKHLGHGEIMVTAKIKFRNGKGTLLTIEETTEETIKLDG